MKTYKLHEDKFSVTITVDDGPAAGEYETDLHSLTVDVTNGVWDSRRSIVVAGVEKNLKLKVDDCQELQIWVEAWEAIATSNPHECADCGCKIARGHETFVNRNFRGSALRVALCECCSDSVEDRKEVIRSFRTGEPVRLDRSKFDGRSIVEQRTIEIDGM